MTWHCFVVSEHSSANEKEKIRSCLVWIRLPLIHLSQFIVKFFTLLHQVEPFGRNTEEINKFLQEAEDLAWKENSKSCCCHSAFSWLWFEKKIFPGLFPTCTKPWPGLEQGWVCCTPCSVPGTWLWPGRMSWSLFPPHLWGWKQHGEPPAL